MLLEMLRLLAGADLEVCEGVCDATDETESLRGRVGTLKLVFKDERDLDSASVMMMGLCDDEPEWAEAPSLRRETGDRRGVNDPDKAGDGGPESCHSAPSTMRLMLEGGC